VGAGGGLGSLAQQYAKAMGLQVIAIDTGEDKEKMCKELGASSFIDFGNSSDLVKDVQAATEDGLGPHAVLLVAVNEQPFQQAAEVSQLGTPYREAWSCLQIANDHSTSDHVVLLSVLACQRMHTLKLQCLARLLE
jgi:threonine dehydrogenase-like Zn-dependent dehydrogenase